MRSVVDQNVVMRIMPVFTSRHNITAPKSWNINHNAMETSNLDGLFMILRIKPYCAPAFINLKYAKLLFRVYQTAAVTVFREDLSLDCWVEQHTRFYCQSFLTLNYPSRKKNLAMWQGAIQSGGKQCEDLG